MDGVPASKRSRLTDFEDLWAREDEALARARERIQSLGQTLPGAPRGRTVPPPGVVPPVAPPGTPTVDRPQAAASPGRGVSRRRLLKWAGIGVPVAAGTALVARGGYILGDAWWREHTVADMAENTGRAQALHTAADGVVVPQLSLPAPGPELAESSVVEQLPAIEAPAWTPGPRLDLPTANLYGQEVIGRVLMPSINVDALVVPLRVVQDSHGQPAWQTANRAVGYHLGTGRPGEAGNACFSAHISSIREGDVFRHLPDIKVGDMVTVSLENTVNYRVVDKLVVLPSDSWVMGPTATPVSTFITCVPDGVYSHRLVVVTELVKA